MLRLKDAAGDVLIRVGITPEELTVARMNAEETALLKRVRLTLAPETWHTLALKFDGPEFVATLGAETSVTSDPVFETDKVDVDILITGGPVGLRNFSLTPSAAPAAQVE